ncbi:MAG: hypothetical protein FWC60_08380 [Firmicutes bacterium]|nr:hypothetical protein [Bacillota bacterium]
MLEESKNLEQMLINLLDIKNKHKLDNNSFMVLLGLVNLMGIINLMEGRAKPDPKKGGE